MRATQEIDELSACAEKHARTVCFKDVAAPPPSVKGSTAHGPSQVKLDKQEIEYLDEVLGHTWRELAFGTPPWRGSP
ncbi:MAG: hypothetical protein ACYCOU_22050, partial [Sulfobacillus sp.]